MDYKDMTFLEAMEIRARILKPDVCHECTIDCSDCPLSNDNNGKHMPCREFMNKHPEEYLRILADYDKAHPVKTILQDFKEKYPNTLIKKDGMPMCCPNWLGKYEEYCDGKHDGGCVTCWNQPVEEQK